MPSLSPAHNLLVAGDRLYVGWYKAGLQAFGFDSGGFVDRPVYHQVQTEPSDDAYDGAWNVLLATAGASTYVFQSDRRYGLIVDKLLPTPTPTPTVRQRPTPTRRTSMAMPWATSATRTTTTTAPRT